jgi:hypothetical protein
MSQEVRLFEILPVGSRFRVDPIPFSKSGGSQAARFWLTEVSDVTRDPEDQPQGPDIFELQRVGHDFIRLTKEGHMPIILPLAACAFLSV